MFVKGITKYQFFNIKRERLLLISFLFIFLVLSGYPLIYPGYVQEGKFKGNEDWHPVEIEGKCTDCHDKNEHSTYHFLLTGKHKTVGCYQCHNRKIPNTPKIRKEKMIVYECQRCHLNKHPGNRLNCSVCHSTDGWQVEGWFP